MVVDVFCHVVCCLQMAECFRDGFCILTRALCIVYAFAHSANTLFACFFGNAPASRCQRHISNLQFSVSMVGHVVAAMFFCSQLLQVPLVGHYVAAILLCSRFCFACAFTAASD